MTMNLGLGFDAELNYRQERLRADFRRTHGTNTPRGQQRRWWQRRPATAVATGRMPAAVSVRHGAKAVIGTVEVAPVAVRPATVARGHPVATRSTDGRAHAA